MRKIISLSCIILLFLFSACDEQPNEQPKFSASEYRILAEDTTDVLNIDDPQYILSEQTSVVTAVFENGDIVIKSVRKGRTNVLIGDKIGFSNQARIQIFVENTGKIKIEGIDKYDGKAVNPIIKYAVTVNGTIGNIMPQTRIDLQMNGTHFIVTMDMDVTSWFINLPKGLTAKIFDIFASNPGYPNEVSIYISGTPISASSENIKITVPAKNTGRNHDVYFNTRNDAVFDIDEFNVSFENFSSPSVLVTNSSGVRLVAFKNSVTENNLISGVPVDGLEHGLKKDDLLFNESGAFIFIFITEDEYKKNKSNLSLAEIFTRYFVLYNREDPGSYIIQISEKLGGDGRLIINNSTDYTIEIRNYSTNGEILSSIPPTTMNMEIRLNAPNNYILYPVFKKYNSFTGEMSSYFPIFNSGDLERKAYSFSFNLGFDDNTFSWDSSDIDNQDTSLFSGGFYLIVDNNSLTSVQLINSYNTLLSTTGFSIINPGRSYTYLINYPRNPDSSYPSERSISDLKIGIANTFLTIDPTFRFKKDFIYKIQVEGSNASNLSLSGIVETGQIDFAQ